MKCLVLDAMGVLFRAGDDVGELLIPYIIESGSTVSEAAIQDAYLDASLGRLRPDEFWAAVKIDPAKEDDYLSRHSLADGVDVVLKTARDCEIPVWCLSNDVGRWSQKLRRLFGLDKMLSGSVISGDVGIRKPDTGIYELLLHRSGFEASELVFVDDRRKNVDAAISLGMDAIEFDAHEGFESLISRIELA